MYASKICTATIMGITLSFVSGSILARSNSYGDRSYNLKYQGEGYSKLISNVLWPGGIIPYEIGEGFSPAERSSIQAAIDDYHRKTCLRWVPRQGATTYARFEVRNSSDGCAFVQPACYGEGFVNILGFNTNCRNTGVMIHEMGHVACLDHEFARFDRDSYIIQADCTDGIRPYGRHLYDYLSAMHYPCEEWCLTPKLPGVSECGQLSEDGRLSVLDVEKINDLYNCGGCQSYRFRFPTEISPELAFASGQDSEGATLFTCRAYVDGNIFIGKSSASLTSCWVPDRGLETGMATGFEVLTNPSSSVLAWVVASGIIPFGAVAGGRSKSDENAYIGRCSIAAANGTIFIIPGTVLANTPKQISIPFDGREHICHDFEILTCL